MRNAEIDFDELYQLPSDWKWHSLEDLISVPKRDIVDGPFGSNLKASEYLDEGVPVARLQNINRNEFIHKNIKFISKKKAEMLSRHSFHSGDILITKLGDPLGKACIVPETIPHGIIVADIVRVRTTNGMDKRYLTYAINSPFIARQFEKHIKGTTRPRVNLGIIRKLPIPVAPKKQQPLIVAEIEKQFSRLDEAVTGLKRVKGNLKRYKAAVLKAAVEGKLTEEWRKAHPNVERGEHLLKRILAERKKKWEEKNPGKKYKEPAAPDTSSLPELPKGWTWATAEQLTDENRAITYGVIKLGETFAGGVPVLRSSDVRQLRIDLANVKSISPKIAANYRRTFLKGGEVVITVRGTLGGIAVVPPQCNGFNVSREVAMLALVEPAMADLIAAFIASAPVETWLMRRTTGIAYTGINIETLKMLPVPIPPFVEQTVIVAEVERHLSVITEIETAVTTNLKRSERLRQGILKKAFSGGLMK